MLGTADAVPRRRRSAGAAGAGPRDDHVGATRGESDDDEPAS
jgi:hypothetical protein